MSKPRMTVKCPLCESPITVYTLKETFGKAWDNRKTNPAYKKEMARIKKVRNKKK